MEAGLRIQSETRFNAEEVIGLDRILYRNEIAMSQLMRFPSSVKRDPAIKVWMHKHPGELGVIAQRWFEFMRACGDDVQELLHDGHPTACVGDAAFGYVNVFKAHVNVGFFRGAEIAAPMVCWRAMASSCAMLNSGPNMTSRPRPLGS